MSDEIVPAAGQALTDPLTQGVPSGSEAILVAEIPTPMLEVHAPHETIRGWKSFLTHIAAIVVGLLIAVGLEQTVELIHHRHQRLQLETALKKDGDRNRGYVREDIIVAQAVLNWALGQAAALEHAGPTGPISLRSLPPGFLGSPDAGVWPSAKASGVTNLLPTPARNWIEYLTEEYNETFVSPASARGQLYLAYSALDQIIIGRATPLPSGDNDLSMLTPAQRLAAVECLRAIAERARTVLRSLVTFDAGNEFILATPLDQLDTPEAASRYTQIFKEKLQMYPAASLSFGGY